MLKNHLRRDFIYFLLPLILFSCVSESKFIAHAKMNVTDIPADYNPQKHILLVAEMQRLYYPKQKSNAITNKLDKALKENFPYKYEIVSLKDIYEDKAKYGDTSVYKYALLNSVNTVTHTTTTTTTTANGSYSVSPSAKTAYLDFAFYDRVNKNRYPNTGNSSPRIGWVVKALTELLKKAKK
jgi:hypothetical protein